MTDKLERITEIVNNADEIIKDIYGATIIEGYADVFNMIKAIIDEK